MTKPTLTALRIDSAEAVGYETAVVPMGIQAMKQDGVVHIWQPDLNNDQLVELIEFLRSKDAWFPWHTIIRPANDDWKLAIMRAVAEVTDDK